MDPGHLVLCYWLSFGIAALVELAADTKTGISRGSRNEIHDHGDADKRPTPPVPTDVREETVFDLVPLARPRRQVTHGNGEPARVRKLLQFPFPESNPGAIASPRISSNQEGASLRVNWAAHLLPPTPNRFHCEGSCVVVNPNAHPARVSSKIVHTIGNRLSLRGNDEVVDSDRLRVPLGTPCFSWVFEVPHQLLLLGINRDHRLRPSLKSPNRRVDVPKLGVAIWVLRAFTGLPIRLKAIAFGVQEVCNQHVPHG